MGIADLYGSWRRSLPTRLFVTPTPQPQKKNNKKGKAAAEAPPRGRGRRPSRRKWSEKKVDSEFDMVIVPPDGISVSGSESDADSDWSVGWFEPHSPRFSGDQEDAFAVLMPCYGSPAASDSRNAFEDHPKPLAPPLPTPPPPLLTPPPPQHHHRE